MISRFMLSISTVALILSLGICARADITGPLENALATTAQSSSYHFEGSMGSGKSIVGDYAKPSSYHTTMLGMEMIIVGGNAYMRHNSGTWRKFPSFGNAFSFDVMKQFADKQRKNFTSKDLGMETAGGQTMHAYEVDDLKTHHTETVYLDGSGRIGRIESKKFTMVFSRYDQAATIKAPM